MTAKRRFLTRNVKYPRKTTCRILYLPKFVRKHFWFFMQKRSIFDVVSTDRDRSTTVPTVTTDTQVPSMESDRDHSTVPDQSTLVVPTSGPTAHDQSTVANDPDQFSDHLTIHTEDPRTLSFDDDPLLPQLHPFQLPTRPRLPVGR